MLCYNTFEIKGRKKKINYKGENYVYKIKMQTI